MSNGYYSFDPGIDSKDEATDEYLLNEALSGEDRAVFDGYYDAILMGDSWTKHPDAPGVTQLQFEQRRHRVFLLVNRFRPRTKEEAEARRRAINVFSPPSENYRDDRCSTLAKRKTEQGRTR